MCNDREAIRARRQRTWADLTYLEQSIERHQSIFGSIPAHWQRARQLLYRDLRAMAAPAYKATDSAQRLLGTVRKMTVNSQDVLTGLDAVLTGHQRITGQDVSKALSNLGDRPERGRDLGYPTRRL